MRDTVYSRRRAVARLLAVCAVLFGLFLMHGAPATAASGCHDAMPVSAPVEHLGHAVGRHHGDTAMAPAAGPVTPHAAPQGVSAGHGAQCVAVPARDRLLLPVWALAAVAVAVFSAGVLAGRRWSPGEVGWRGPLGGGRELLRRVCIARR